MLNLTKATIITWQSDEESNYTPLDVERQEKIALMVADNKTDGDVYFTGVATYMRDWTSQEAAQEFIDFSYTLAQKYSKVIVSATITDK